MAMKFIFTCTPSTPAMCWASDGIDAWRGWRPLSLMAWLLKDLSSFEYKTASLGLLNRAQMYQAMGCVGRCGGVQISNAQQFSSMFECTVTIRQQVPKTKSPKLGNEIGVSVIIQPLEHSCWVKLMVTAQQL
jgi:hypothetical protein